MEAFKCPKCGFKFEDDEIYSKFVTYWGDDEWEECEEFKCSECEHKFLVKETVTRTWEVAELPIEAEEVPDGDKE